MTKKIPLQVWLSLPCALLILILFPLPGSLEFSLDNSWSLDALDLEIMPRLGASDYSSSLSMLQGEGIQYLNRDGTLGSHYSGEVFGVGKNFWLENTSEGLYFHANTGEKVFLDKALGALVSPESSMLISPEGFSLSVYDNTGALLWNRDFHEFISALESLDERYFVVGTANGTLMLFDRGGKLLQQFVVDQQASKALSTLHWDEESRKLIAFAGSSPQYLLFYTLESPEDSTAASLKLTERHKLPVRRLRPLNVYKVFKNTELLIDLESEWLLYRPEENTYRVIKADGDLINAFMVDDSNILALVSQLRDGYNFKLIQREGREILSIDRNGVLQDCVPLAPRGLLFSRASGIQKLDWGFR